MRVFCVATELLDELLDETTTEELDEEETATELELLEATDDELLDALDTTDELEIDDELCVPTLKPHWARVFQVPPW